MKLSMLAAIAMAGSLVACGNKVPEVTMEYVEDNKVDAVQKIDRHNKAVEFTPKTNPNKQCIAILPSRRSGDYGGGVACWDKTPSP